MSLYTSLVSSLLFPLHERLKKHASTAMREELERTQWLSAPALQALQAQRLREFVQDIVAHVPYYRDLFARLGLRAQDIQGVDDLRRLPFLTKPVIRAHGDALRHNGSSGLKRLNTGGSSGEPLIFYVGRKRVSHDVASKWRATRWWGVDIGDPEIVVWGSPIELGTQDRVKQVRDRVMRTHLLPAFEMSDERLDEFIRSIRSIRPRMLFGYPSALSRIAAHARKRQVAMDDLGIKVAFVTSERLYDDQRALISETFGCPVANGYGGRDAGFIAHQCPAGSMHLTAEDIIVEIVDEAGEPVPDGVAGEIVVTHLATNEFPFVRYRTGDIAVLGRTPCSCGRGLPVLQEIQGRSTDFVVAANGTAMHGLSLIYILRDLPGVQAFKIIQESLELTRVQLVADASVADELVPTIVSGFKQRLGAGVRVEVERVPEIAKERSGKYRYVVSHVGQSVAG